MNTTMILLTSLLTLSETRLIGEPVTKYNGFGTDVAVLDYVALVGEPGIYHDILGKATIFTAPGGDWKMATRTEIFQPMATNHSFGWSVALGESCAIVSAPPVQKFLDEIGAVFRYELKNNAWLYMGPPITSEGPGDEFGYSVAASSDCKRVVVGAPSREVNNVEDAGAAEIFEWTGANWISIAGLSQPAQAAGNRFGNAVAIAPNGTAVVIGSYYTAAIPGRAYVYSEDDGWDPVVLKGQTEVQDRFGYAVAIDDDGTVVVGAPYEDDPMQEPDNHAGRVYVCPAALAGDPTCTRVSVSMGVNTTDALGSDVAIEGDLIVAGATHGGGGNEGEVWLITRQGEDWIEGGVRLQGAEVQNYDLFGSSVALSGSTIAVGAYGQDVKVMNMTIDESGAAYVFTFDKQKGDLCGSPMDCPTGYCVDGYCCDSPCGDGDQDDCLVCDAKPGFCTTPDTEMCVGDTTSGGETDGTSTTDTTTTDTTSSGTTDDTSTTGGATSDATTAGTASTADPTGGSDSSESTTGGTSDSGVTGGCTGSCPEPSPCECNASGEPGMGALAFAGLLLLRRRRWTCSLR